MAIAAGAVPLTSGLPVYEELLADGERGLLHPPGESQVLAAQLEKLLGDEESRKWLMAELGLGGDNTEGGG